MAAQSTPLRYDTVGAANGMPKKQYVWYCRIEGLGTGETATIGNEDSASVAVVASNDVAIPINCKTKLYLKARSGSGGDLVVYTQKPGARFAA